MNDFSSFGYLALLLSVVCGAFTFTEIRHRYNMPWFLNLPGSIFAAITAFLMAGFGYTITGVFELTMTQDFPGIPGIAVINMLIATVCWYWLSNSILKIIKTRQGQN